MNAELFESLCEILRDNKSRACCSPIEEQVLRLRDRGFSLSNIALLMNIKQSSVILIFQGKKAYLSFEWEDWTTESLAYEASLPREWLSLEEFHAKYRPDDLNKTELKAPRYEYKQGYDTYGKLPPPDEVRKLMWDQQEAADGLKQRWFRPGIQTGPPPPPEKTAADYLSLAEEWIAIGRKATISSGRKYAASRAMHFIREYEKKTQTEKQEK